MFVWTDIDTTGLDTSRDAILVIGMIITDNAFVECARHEWLVGGTSVEALARMQPYVRDMHTKSGLLQRLADRTLPCASEVYQQVDDWLEPHVRGQDPKPVMAGNSVHFERRFLAAQMPNLLDLLHYRLLDVSSLKVLCLATVPGAQAWEDARKPAAHTTPLTHLEGSMLELAHWRKVLADRA